MTSMIKAKQLLLTACTWLLAAKTYAQPKTITLECHNEPFETVISRICLSNGIEYASFPGRFRNCSRVTEKFKNVPLGKALDRLCRNQPLDCRSQGDTVLVIETRDLKGQVTGEAGEPLAGVTIITDNNRLERTDEEGMFSISHGAQNYSIEVSHISYFTRQITLDGGFWLPIHLKPKASTYGDPNGVNVHDGYNGRPRDRATGAFAIIGQSVLTARPSGTLDALIDNRVAGMTVQVKNRALTSSFPPVSIRGISTFFANPGPLLVVDNFPYDGNLNQLNPEDIENITILKDAAASSIWGARAGNGVIVITTKKGKYKRRPQLSFSAQTTVWGEYNSHYLPALGSASSLSLEDSLYRRGFYNLALLTGYGFVPPGVEVLDSLSKGKLTGQEATARLKTFAAHDARNDMDKYYYRRTVAQQYHISLQGGDTNSHYFLSGGYDQLNNGLTQGKQYRYTLNGNYTFKPMKALEVYIGTAINGTGAQNDTRLPGVSYAYATLANPDGTPAVVNRDRSQVVKDSLVRNGLRDWSYRPLEELGLRDDSLHRLQARLAMNIGYNITKDLKAQLSGQYLDEQTTYSSRYSTASYTYRNLYNSFPASIPEGPMEDQQHTRYRATNLRLQLDGNHAWEKWELTARAGVERTVMLADTTGGRRYSKDVNFNVTYPAYDVFLPPAPLPGKPYATSTDDRYWSYYANTGLTWRDRYFLTLSARVDQSNLFGARTNAQTQPLWSAGGKWRFTKDVDKPAWLEEGSLRASIGRSGNIDKSTPAMLTMNPGVLNQYGAEARTILNAANAGLRWETSTLLNIGLDVQLFKNHLSGSLDYYYRSSNDLLSNIQTRTTAGAIIYRSNVAALQGHGIELQLNARLPLGDWQWNSSLLLAYTTNKVTRVDTVKQTVAGYIDATGNNLRIGRSTDALFALRAATLDPNTGDPRTWFNGSPGTGYADILASPADSLPYIGHSTPPWTAAISQSITCKGITVSFTVVGLFDYYYRRLSLSYSDLGTGAAPPHRDYDRRWQKPGDELFTGVPSFPTTFDPARDKVYGYGDALVEKAGNIRLREVKLSWNLTEKWKKKLHLAGGTLFIEGANLGILWKASSYDLDPDSPMEMPLPKSFSAGLRINL
jgi:TonB-linked SusC/RagA family outer membrane protein